MSTLDCDFAAKREVRCSRGPMKVGDLLVLGGPVAAAWSGTVVRIQNAHSIRAGGVVDGFVEVVRRGPNASTLMTTHPDTVRVVLVLGKTCWIVREVP